jgi:hypothetical protein
MQKVDDDDEIRLEYRILQYMIQLKKYKQALPTGAHV